MAALCGAPTLAQARERNFDIPSQPANRAVVEFARQAGLQIVAPGSKLRKIRTKAIKGRYEVRAALEAMLDGTGIRIVSYTGNLIALGVSSSPARKAERAGTRTEPDYQKPPQPPASSIAQEDAAWPAAIQTRTGTGYILVTGSRLKTNGYDSPVPLTVIDGEMAEDLGQNNASETVRLIPQNIATQSDAVSGLRLSPDIGAAYANLRGLNPAFGTRTLTLVNGRRFVPTSDGGQVDLNLIPSILIERVETVTGGASAAYGSDAVAGVVNIILDNQLEGFRSQVNYGQTGRGDGKSAYAGVAYGLSFGQGRGHLTMGGEYQRNRGIDQCAASRNWCAEGWTVFTNAANIEPGTLNAPGNVSGYDVPGSDGYGLPNYVVGPKGGLIYNSPFGAVRNFVAAGNVSTTTFSASFPDIAPPLAAVDKVFTADGKGIVDYDPGRFGPKHVGALSQGGDNSSAYADQYIQTPLERFTTYASAEYELSDRLTLSAELTYGERKANSRTLTAATRSTMAIKPDNAFLPPELRELLDGSAFSLGKDVDGELDNRISVNARAFRGLVGLSGELSSAWSWDAYYQYGENRRRSSIRYSRNNDALAMAIDAVEDASRPGHVVCRPLSPAVLDRYEPAYQAELLELHASCVPLNLFGQGNMSQAAIDFAWRPVGEHFTYHQHAMAGSIQGTLADGWGAGPIGMAAGFEYRSEGGAITHGGIDPSDYAFNFGLDYSGRIRVAEGFLETNLPLFRDSSLGEFLELNGAVRYSINSATDRLTDQSKTVNATSWKLGAIYDLGAGLRIRTTRSRDIRAAGFRELFRKTAPTEEGTAQGRVDNPNIAGPNKADATPIYTGGNFALGPEKADTTTAGAVLAPSFVPGLRLSLDWYRIKLKDAIADLNGQRVVDLCVNFDLLCDRVAFASPTDIVRVDAGQANVGRIEIRGFDFETSYHLALTELSPALEGSLDFCFLLNHQYDFIVQQNPDVPAIDYAGQSGPVTDGGDFYPTPKWMWNALIGYETERFNVTATIRHIGQGVLDRERIGPEDPGYAPTLPNSISSNRVAAATYVNLAMSYRIPFGDRGEDDIEMFGAIENLFDKKPPIAPGGGVSTGATAYPTNPVYFDTFGMRWKAGLRLRF